MKTQTVTKIPISSTLTANSSRRGFTLIELIIYMGLLSIFMVVMTDLLTQILDLRTQSTAQSFVTSDGNYLRDKFAYDIRRSSAIATPATIGSTNTQLVLTIGGVNTAYSVQNNALVLTTGGISNQLTTSDVSIASFSATRVGNGTGKDTIQLSYTLLSKRTAHSLPIEQKTYALTIGTR